MAWHSNLGMQRGADITLYSFARYIPWHTQSLANICICTLLPASLIGTLRQKWLVCCAVAKLLSISKFMIQDHREIWHAPTPTLLLASDLKVHLLQEECCERNSDTPISILMCSMIIEMLWKCFNIWGESTHKPKKAWHVVLVITK